MDENQQYGEIICSNKEVRKMVQSTVKEFVAAHKNLLADMKANELDGIEQLKLLDTNISVESLNAKVMSDKVQLALCGENSSGKTSFLHMLLGTPDISPIGDGPVTGRIVRFTYTEQEHACIRVYKTLRDRFGDANGNMIHNIPLDSYFSDDSICWDEIADKISEYTARPAEYVGESDEFVMWARHLVEIHLPLPILKLNIDVYDTPGFLFHDAPVLKENLAELVSLVRPTIVFLYNNSSGSKETIDSYLLMKDALKEIDSLSIFYLNSKVDVGLMKGIEENTTIEQFVAILREERAKRYQLLKETSCLAKDNLDGLPKTVDECNYFDVCSVLSNEDELGSYMNNSTKRRLIQFVAKTDLINATRVTRMILPSIEAFFYLGMMATTQTTEKLKQLRSEALSWYDTFFSQHRKYFDLFLTTVFQLIEDEINDNREKLIIDAAKLKDRGAMESYIETFVQHNAVRRSLPGMLHELIDNVQKFLEANTILMINVSSNELLIGALQAKEKKTSDDRLDQSKELGVVKNFALNFVISSAMFVVDFLFTKEDNEEAELLTLLAKLLLKPRQEKSKKQPKFGESHDYESVARNCLNDLEELVKVQKRMLHDIIEKLSKKHKDDFEEEVKELYNYTEKLIPSRNKIHSLVMNHSPAYAQIYCKLYACQDFAKFDGVEPKIVHEEVQKTIYSVARARWRTESLLLKHLNDSELKNSGAAYFEARYHLKVKRLAIPYIVDIKYVYEKRSNDGSTELWMFFPVFEQTLKSIIENPQERLTFDQVRDMMSRVAIALECLHTNEIVHQNITATNIVFDEKNKAHLIDLGDWINDHTADMIHRHHAGANKLGVYEDIRALGKLGRSLKQYFRHVHETRLASFELLLDKCESASSIEPLTAKEIKSTLERI